MNKTECWSANEENFNYETLGDLLDSHGDLEPGHIVYVGDAQHPLPERLCDADDVLEMMSDRACDIGGEYAEDYPDPSKEAVSELEELLKSWIMKHCPPSFYEVRNVREYVLTDADVAEKSAPLSDTPEGYEP